ncbi:MAG: hypothetical protein U0V70_00255 [Terriglobia bacterium]
MKVLIEDVAPYRRATVGKVEEKFVVLGGAGAIGQIVVRDLL